MPQIKVNKLIGPKQSVKIIKKEKKKKGYTPLIISKPDNKVTITK